MIFRFLCVAVLLLSSVSRVQAQPLQEFVDNLTGHDEIPGIALIVQKGDDVQSFFAGIGEKNSPEWPVTANSKFHLGSVTKLYTGLAVMKMVNDKKISLDDLIKDHVSADFNGEDIANFSEVTFRHVLENRSGLVDLHSTDFIQDTFLNNACVESENAAVKHIRGLTATHKVGEVDASNSSSYVILGSVLKAKYGHPDLGRIYDKLLFSPLQIKGTGFAGDKQTVFGVERYNPSFPAVSTKIWTGCMKLADSGLVASAEDLRKFLRVFFNSDIPVMKSIRSYMLDTPAGLDVWDTSFGAAYGHKGRFPGYASAAYYFPVQDTTIIVLANSGLLHLEKTLESIAGFVFTDDFSVENYSQFLWRSYQDEQAKHDVGLSAPDDNIQPF